MDPNSSSGGYTCEVTEVAETHTIRVAAVVQELFPSIQKDNPPQDWLKNFLFRLSKLLQTTPEEATKEVTQRLKRHIHTNSVGNPSVDLVAASMLLCHPHLHQRQYPNKNVPLMPKFLPTPLREKVSMGIFVPLGHLLYAEALMQKVALHVLPNGKCVDPDPYPLDTNEPAPEKFVVLVRRPDVLRGLSTHAFTLAFRFPLLAADMHGLARHMAILMYVHGLSAAAAIDLYDSFFWEFQRQLSLMKVMPLDQFPSWLVDSVFVRHGIHSHSSNSNP